MVTFNLLSIVYWIVLWLSDKTCWPYGCWCVWSICTQDDEPVRACASE